MKIKLLLIALAVSISATAQWTSRAAFPGTARAKATSFTIGDKIYLMGGVTNFSVILNDFWEYDITLNTWTQKPNFPGPERYGAVSFVLGGTGYIATGGNDNGHLDDMWQYNATTSTWLQRTGLPAGSAQHENQRAESYSFVINNKAYIGGGNGWVFGANSTNPIAFTDLWEYDPSTNSWTTKATLPDQGKNMAVAGVVNGKGYVGLGCNVDQTINHTSMWEYDPSNDSWTAKTNFPTNFTTDAASFVIDSSMYVVGGVNLNPVGLTSEVYRFDVSANTWTQLTNYTGGGIAGPIAVAVGNRAFVAGGYNSNVVPRNDVWEFTSATTGISNLNFSNKDVVIYPSPASEFISIASSENISLINIYDVNGKNIISENNSFENINISKLTAGIYFVNYTLNNGTTGAARFMKQ